MKKLLTIPILLFTLIFSTTSYAEWTLVGGNDRGTSYYVDFERIKKHDGYIYFWVMSDFLIPAPTGEMSAIIYHQGDCKIFRLKRLSYLFYKESEGKGNSETKNPPNPEWDYASPNSSTEGILKTLCDWVK